MTTRAEVPIMQSLLDASHVRIRTTAGTIVGAGFLVGERNRWNGGRRKRCHTEYCVTKSFETRIL